MNNFFFKNVQPPPPLENQGICLRQIYVARFPDHHQSDLETRLGPFFLQFPTMQDGLNGLSALSTSTRVANLRVSRSNLDPLKTHGESKGTVPPRNKGPNKAPY